MPYVTETTITDIVLKRRSAVPDPRLRQIMQSMITHLHAFVREIEPTEGEWGGRDRMFDPNRAAIERQAAGVHPCFRCGRRQHACRLHQPSPLGRCDADHGDRAVPRA
jgi:hypothetical protein